MKRQTSAEAFNKFKATTGKSKQQQAWEALKRWGPRTARELDESVGTQGLWKRLSELRSRGLVKELEVRCCRVTGYDAIVWQAVTP